MNIASIANCSPLHELSPSSMTNARPSALRSLGPILAGSNSWVALALAIGIASFGFDLFNFPISIDEELHAAKKEAETAWISFGRWGLYLLNAGLLPYTIVPVVPLALAWIAIGYALKIIAELWSAQRTDFLFAAPFLICFPTVFYMLTFNNVNFSIGIGIFLASASAFLWLKGNRMDRTIAVAMLGMSIGIYQAMLFLIIPILGPFLLKGDLKLKSQIRVLLSAFLFCLLGLAFYYSVSNLFLAAFHMELRYVDGYMQIDELLRDPMRILSNSWHLIMRYLGGVPSRHPVGWPMSTVVLLLASGAVLWAAWKQGARVLAASAIGIAAMLASAFLLAPFTGGYLPARSLIAAPMSFAAVALLGLKCSQGLFHFALKAMLCLALLQFCVVGNRLAYSDYVSNQADKRIAAEILSIARQGNLGAAGEKVPFMLMGLHKPQLGRNVIQTETFGASFFSFGAGSTMRAVFFMKAIGMQNFEAVQPQRRAELFEAVLSLPDWPAKGSISIIDGVVAIKFGDPTAQQMRRLCAAGLHAMRCD